MVIFKSTFLVTLTLTLTSGSIYALDQYEKDVNDVCKHAESVCDRKAYNGLMTYLKKITKYPDGREKANQIAKEWKEIDRRRPAMMDELRKAGF
ncbi:hypothetical protein [Faecalibacillus intestinalis]